VQEIYCLLELDMGAGNAPGSLYGCVTYEE